MEHRSDTKIQIRELQEHLLPMLRWFHTFCIEHGLTYYAQGGTMLGAVRHQGFIPWDDDLDVGLPRCDYEKLLKLGHKRKKELPYVLESYHDGHRDFEYPYAKLYDPKTTLTENRRKQTKRGIFIDIFPLDGIGDSENEVKKNYREIQHLLNVLAVRSCGVRKGRDWYKNLAVRGMNLIPDFLLDNQKLIRKLDHCCRKHSYEENLYIGNLMGNWRIRESMNKEIYGKPTLYHFEDTVIFGAEHPEEYLTHLYGDWKRLPPEEKRESHHDYLEYDLRRPYVRS